MKNIHILATDRLTLDGVKIYITSDEEIKEGDWFLTPINELERANKEWMGTIAQFIPKTNFKKIILTTDQDLIKDGVQAIDDDFLEWFVKNPSCEWVKVIYEPKNYFDIKQGWEYEIIITKEEPTIEEEYLKDELKKYDGIDVVVLNKPEEPKQETLEEVARTKFPYKLFVNVDVTNKQREAFIEGYKLAQERSYSKEEVLEMLNYFGNEIYIKQWFEQFKKK